MDYCNTVEAANALLFFESSVNSLFEELNAIAQSKHFKREPA